MRIGYDAKRFFHNTTGLGNYSRDLLRILSEFYPDNSYFLYNPKPGKVKRLKPDGKIMREILPSSFIGKTFPSWWRTKGIIRDIKQDKLDIFHGLTGELPLGLKNTGVRSIVTIHDLIFMYFPEMYNLPDRKIYYRKFRYAAQTADKIIAISKQTKNDIVKYLNVEPAKISVVYQGCHPAFKLPVNQQIWEELKERYNLPPDYLLYVGAINERKNALTLVKSMQYHDYTLVMVGSGGGYYKKVLKAIEESRIKNRIRLMQGLNMEQIAALYKHARIFIYPSLFEGFGIPIIESLYSKTPVITTAGGVFPEAGGPGSIYLKNPLNEKEIAEQTVRLWEDSSLLKQLAEKGYRYVQQFNDETIARNWHHVYNELRE